MTRVTSLTQTKTKNEPIKKLTKEESAIVACSSRWKHMREEVQHKKWSECPTPMVADFVKSVAFDIEAEYGNNGATKAIEIFSCILAKENIEHFEISGAWVEGAASISMIFNKNP